MAEEGSGSSEVDCTSCALFLTTATDRSYRSTDGAWTRSENSGSVVPSAGPAGVSGAVSDNDCKDDGLAIG